MAALLNQLLGYAKPAVVAYQQGQSAGGSVLNQIEAYAKPILNGIKPHVVLTAPNGERLFIDVTPPADSAPETDTTLWPNGFKLSLATGNPPQTSDVTTSPGTFFLNQSPALLNAPGPLGFTWSDWLVISLMITLIPFLGYHLLKK